VFIFRYYADVSYDKYLCDDGLIADPDFFSNRQGKETMPIWSICGVYHRDRLRKGAMIFFLPVKQRLERANIPSYICTGVLVVGEILPDKGALLQDPRITARYKELYMIDLREHLREDLRKNHPITAEKRPFKIVLGNPKKSMSFGPNQLDFQRVLKELGMNDISKILPKRNNRNLRSLDYEELSNLYKRLKIHLKPICDSQHNHNLAWQSATCFPSWTASAKRLTDVGPCQRTRKGTGVGPYRDLPNNGQVVGNDV